MGEGRNKFLLHTYNINLNLTTDSFIPILIPVTLFCLYIEKQSLSHVSKVAPL